jgi:polar amino acid transport system substrate-binding protein
MLRTNSHPRRVSLAAVVALMASALIACGSAGATARVAHKAQIATGAAALPAGCTPSQTKTKYPQVAGETISVAVSPLSPPYISTAANNPSHIIGFEADLLNAWTACLGVKYKWQVYQDFGDMVPAVQSGRDDIIQSSIFSTPVRAKQVNFVDYMKSYTGSILPKGNPKHITTLESMCGKTDAEVVGGVEPAIVQAQSKKCVKDGKPAIQMSLYKDNATAEQQVKDGRDDVFLVDAGLASVLVKDFPSQLQTGFRINSGLSIGTAVGKKETQLLSAIDASIKTLQKDGIINKLLSKWGISPIQAIPVTLVK